MLKPAMGCDAERNQSSSFFYSMFLQINFNPLNAELNPICHLLALLGGATIVGVSRLRVNIIFPYLYQSFKRSVHHISVCISYLSC
jgi:hypothetical protein